ncbi:hypothetical protein ACHAPJ_010560 [Fusarium lateritium]
MTPYPTSPLWECKAIQVEGFCTGSDFVLANFVTDSPGNSRFKDAQEPKSWLSDYNSSPQTVVPSRRLFSRVLNNKELYQALQQKRFCEDPLVKIAGNTRRIFVNNPNGASILALLRTAPASQVYGFRKLFAGYLTPRPAPELFLSDPDWWGSSSFLIFFNLPFLAIGLQSQSDIRTFSDNQHLRRRHDLDFLNLSGQQSSQDRQDTSSNHDNTVLHEAVYSLMITGRSEQYSTTVCLNDDFFDEESRLADEEEILHLDGTEDPITFQAELKRTRSPRAYALVALAKQLEKIVEYHTNNCERLKESLDSYTAIPRDNSVNAALRQRMHRWRQEFPVVMRKASHFNSRLATKVNHLLNNDLMVGPDEVLRGPLWQGLQPDIGAFNSLRSIKNFNGQLGDIDIGFKQLREGYEQVMRERKHNYADEQENRDKKQESRDEKQESRDNRNFQITVAAFVLALLNLVAQVYAGKPDGNDPSAWSGYLIMVAIFNAICVPGILWFVWRYRNLWLGLARNVRNGPNT